MKKITIILSILVGLVFIPSVSAEDYTPEELVKVLNEGETKELFEGMDFPYTASYTNNKLTLTFKDAGSDESFSMDFIYNNSTNILKYTSLDLDYELLAQVSFMIMVYSIYELKYDLTEFITFIQENPDVDFNTAAPETTCDLEVTGVCVGENDSIIEMEIALNNLPADYLNDSMEDAMSSIGDIKDSSNLTEEDKEESKNDVTNPDTGSGLDLVVIGAMLTIGVTLFMIRPKNKMYNIK